MEKFSEVNFGYDGGSANIEGSSWLGVQSALSQQNVEWVTEQH